MSPVVQLVIELLVMLVMITCRMIIWVSSCLDPSEVSVSMTQESGDEASDEESWVSWVNVITFLKDKSDRKSIYILLFFLKD